MTTLQTDNYFDIRQEYKGYILERDPQYGSFSIQTVDGTKVPIDLLSKYTDAGLARQHIDSYIRRSTKDETK
jgi:hypothetical protein